MHPILFQVGGFPIHTYGALGAAGFLVGAGLVLWRAARLGYDANRVADVIFGVAVASLLGARLAFLAQNPASVGALADVFHVREGGLVFYGAFALGVPVGTALVRWRGLPALPMWDLFGAAFPFAHAVSRLGCFAAGCCYGRPTDLPWGVVYPPEAPLAPVGVPVHPVQLYEAGALVLVGVATNLAWSRRRFDGQVLLLHVLLYGLARAALELFRGDLDRGLFVPGLPLSFSQGVGLLLAAVAAVLLVREGRRAREKLAIGAAIRGPRAG